MAQFENSFKLTKAILNVCGINLSSDRSVFLNYLFFFNLLWLYTDSLGELYLLIERVRDGKTFDELSMIAPCFVICCLSTFRSVPLYYNSKLVTIFNKLRDIHPVERVGDEEVAVEDTEDEQAVEEDDAVKDKVDEEKEITDRAVKLFYKVITFMVVANTSVIIAFCVLPLVLMTVDYQKRGDIELKLPFLVKYFFDPFIITRWPFVYLHQIWSTIVVVISLFGADTFFHGCCIYLRMQFELLCSRFENVVTNSKKLTEERLRACILHHRDLIALVEQIEQLYSKSYLFNFISSSVLLCLGGFNIVFSNQLSTVIAYANFLMLCLYQIFMICYFGDMLVTSSSRVGEAVFNCKWYDADENIKKSLHIVLLRSQKPCSITAAKFATLNLRAFTTILSRSWSYFALLKTMYN